MVSLLKSAIGTLLLCCFVNAATASGSHSEYSKTPEDKYDLGKKIFYDQIVCESCPYANLELSRESVSTLLPKLEYDQDLGKQFGVINRTSVQYFIKKRFSL